LKINKNKIRHRVNAKGSSRFHKLPDSNSRTQGSMMQRASSLSNHITRSKLIHSNNLKDFMRKALKHPQSKAKNIVKLACLNWSDY